MLGRADLQFRKCAPVFRPSSVVLVGASEQGGGGWSQRVFDNLAQSGSTTRLYLINPRREELWGRRCYPDFASLPEQVDLAITIIRAELIPETLEAGVAHGLKGAIIFASQFGEGGDAEGAKRAERLRSLSATYDLRICGPNCMGTLAIREGNLFYPSARVRGLPAGPVGVIFQSGGTFMYWLRQGAVRGLGFSYAASSGNELDLDLADYINFMVEDESTRVIACMVEGIRRPAAFMAAASKALAAGKPILIVKIGRSQRGAEQAHTHTGALAGDDVVFDATCRRYGIIRCHSLDDMIEQTLAFSAGRLPRGRRVAMACYSGGGKGLFLDYADENGIVMPQFSPETSALLATQLDVGLSPDNPLDTGAGPATMPQRFADICKNIVSDPGIDILALQAQLPEGDVDSVDASALRSLSDSTDKTLIAFGRLSQNVNEIGRTFQAEAGIPFLQGLPEVCRALNSLAFYGEAVRRGEPDPLPAGADPLAEEVLLQRLREIGVEIPRSAHGNTPEQASELAAEIGFPVALKIISPHASHKTEVGGVALRLPDRDAVRLAAHDMAQRLATIEPTAVVSGFLIQEMIDGLEVLVGFRDDPDYGPYVVFGLGGTLVEAIGDVAIRLLPITDSDVLSMIGQLRGRALFGSFRGKAQPDVLALRDAVCAASHFFLKHRASLSDLEINPLIVREEGKGVRAVDIRAVWK
ncbi:MAG: acetyl-CoA synthetase [Hyphomicrobiales bacterium]|nr:acetyl-CoA synthetase [Hyphomicrobiales bacterium]